jgi:predicted DNA-binding ribbon-helix-helix protein
MFPCCGQSKK